MPSAAAADAVLETRRQSHLASPLEIQMNDRVARFLLTAVALEAAHQVGDHWLQTCGQACHKGDPGSAGARACAGHVASYTAAGVLTVTGAAHWLGIPLATRWLTVGLAANAATHYLADRRVPLRRIAGWLGRRGYIEHVTVVRTPRGKADETGPGTGLFHLDQSWHHAWIFVAALLAAGPRAR